MPIEQKFQQFWEAYDAFGELLRATLRELKNEYELNVKNEFDSSLETLARKLREA